VIPRTTFADRAPATLGHRKSFVKGYVCLVLLSCALTGCQGRDKSGITIDHQLSPLPARVGPERITLILRDSTGQPVSGAQITVEGDMSHAGMAPVFTQAKETEGGQYQADLDLSMIGDWIILVHSTLRNGEKIDRQFEVNGVRAQ